jgi:tRNA(Ile)-lysidine synthase
MFNVLLVSGGSDSVAMLRKAIENNISFEVVHFDHGIRENSYLDAKFVTDLCEKYGIKLTIYHLNLGPAASECDAREARLNILATNHSNNILHTAHNMDDVAETVMFNILRGSGINGCCSLKEKVNITHNGKTLNFYRPLLNLRKYEIVKYLASIEQDHIIDETNNTDIYTRNAIRRQLLPLASSIMNRDVVCNLVNFSSNMLEVSNIIDNLSSDFIDCDVIDCVKYAGNKLNKYNMIRYVKSKYDTSKFAKRHWDAIDVLLTLGASTRVSLPKVDLIIRKKKATFLLRK